jgi:hypothetical protein
MLPWLYTRVSSVLNVSFVSDVRCKFFIRYCKVDLDVAFVGMTTHICRKCMFQMFELS